ncbi:MAG: COX15/CtaA family protein [Alphaproteobacteria bacterium]
MTIHIERDLMMHKNQFVTYWLFMMSFLIVMMVVVGGLTRLTDSGLSITEWAPIAGAIPPLSLEDWMIAFEQYKQIAEYQYQNAGMSLEEFKFIYWWEWGHRQLGRVIGIAFFIPLVVFAALGYIRGRWLLYLVCLLFLGGFQGFLGWFMVESGVVETRLDVSAYRLALHLGMAVILLGLVYHAARSRIVKNPVRGVKAKSLLFLVLLYLQIISGAFVAGTDAGMTYNTWPLMDGSIIPEGVYQDPSYLRSHFEDLMTVQFNHRWLAYIVLLFGFWLFWNIKKVLPLQAKVFLTILCLQIVLGIITLITVAAYQHIWLAALHQLVGIALFLVTVDTVARSHPLFFRIAR